MYFTNYTHFALSNEPKNYHFTPFSSSLSHSLHLCVCARKFEEEEMMICYDFLLESILSPRPTFPLLSLSLSSSSLDLERERESRQKVGLK